MGDFCVKNNWRCLLIDFKRGYVTIELINNNSFRQIADCKNKYEKNKFNGM